tara:strand:- start:20979 stop:21509 length:531 start_codon:yes stop_codon:yes gene_type:complete
MNREQLEHAIRAACDVSGDDELIIFGSQAILGEYPQAHEELRRSIEVDLTPKNKPETVDKIDGALGENSMFHQTHSFYVHGVSIEAAKLPDGWKNRTVQVQSNMTKNNIGWCIEAHDLAASKLIAFREKDTEFVRLLIIEEMISTDILLDRLNNTDAEVELLERSKNWLKRIEAEL